jgi:hypothetical protein
MPVFGYQLATAKYSPEDQEYSLSFHFSNPDPLDSGYELRARLPNNSEVLLGRFVNLNVLDISLHTEGIVRTSSGIIILDANFSENLLPFGTLVRFFLKVYRSDNSYTYETEKLRFRTPVSQVRDFKVWYDSIDLVFSWELKPEETVESYVIERSKGTLIHSFAIRDQLYTGINFVSKEFIAGQEYVVHDLYNDYFWYPVRCIQDGVISISAETLKNKVMFVDYQRTTNINYNIYKFTDPFEEYVTTDGRYFNGSIRVLYQGDDFFYCYRVKGVGGDIEVYSPCQYNRAINIVDKIPRLYPIYESNDIDYGNATFFTMRNALVDENVYKKNPYSLPKKDYDGATYNFRGFAGVADCPVEVFVDDTMFTSVRTDTNGEFSVDFNPPKDSFTMSVVVYNRDQSKQFVPIRDLPFDKVVIYAYFSVLSRQIEVISNLGYTANISRQIITLADEAVIKDWYAKSIGLVFNFDDDYDKFRREVLFLYPLLWNNPNTLSPSLMEQILKYYMDNDYGISDFAIYENGDPLQAGNDLMRLRSSVVTSLKTQLGKNKYTYYVTSVDPENPNIESFPQTISLDYRLYDSPATINYPAIAIVWDPVKPKGQAMYNVYRKINNGPIKLLKTTAASGYIDNGTDIETDRLFPDFQYTNMEMVSNLRFFSRTTIQSMYYGDYAKNFVLVAIYGTNGADSIPFGIRDRLTYLFNSKINPSTKLIIKFI